jgi:hypothetical protein
MLASLDDLSSADRGQIFGGTAVRFYGLTLKRPS